MKLYELCLEIMKDILPHSLSDKIMAGVDTFGLTLSILFYGFGLKGFVDDWFPTAILVLTVVSLCLTILKKIYDFFKD